MLLSLSAETAPPTLSEARSHWAFQPLRQPSLPTLQRTSPDDLTPLDTFVAARLERDGIKLAPVADRVTLIRRLSLDLIGLPPTVEEVDRFLADSDPQAYSHLIDRLLASPHYGEKWARHWLDAARYADSNGFEKDRPRSIWPYRDYVIQAFNRNLPFDQFTIEQLAGDLLPGATVAQHIATGFLRNSMINMEGGVEPEKFRVETIIDRVDAVGRTWLGLTIACAQCHPHKYDPISNEEYYRFYAFLNQDDEPQWSVPNAEQSAAESAILKRVRDFEGQLLKDHPELETREREWEREQLRALQHWQVLDPSEWHSQPMKFEKLEDASLLGGGDVFKDGVLRIWAETHATNITGFQLEALNNGNLPFGGPGLEGDGGFQLCEFTVEAIPLSQAKSVLLTATNTVANAHLIRFRRAVADQESPEWPAAATIDGETTRGGWTSASTFGRRNEERRIVFETEQPFGFPEGTRMLVTLYSNPKDSKLSNYLIGCLRLSLTTDAPPLRAEPYSERQRAWVNTPVADRTSEQQRQLFRVFRQHQPFLEATNRAWDDLWKEWPKSEATTLVLQARPRPRQTHLFKRGDWQKPGESVSADTPQILPPFPTGEPKTRLGLARWLVQPEHPLTARVFVNRVWQQYFGQGLVATSEDFGRRAEPPLYQDVLDWLASDFVSHGWNIQHLHRQIVSSRVYRQSSRWTPEDITRDPYNRGLSRGPRMRVDAEGIQDIALSVSGLLSPKIGGPSVYPPLPEGVMELAYRPIPWNVSEGEDRYRRALYTFWRRSVPYPTLLTFDAPTAEQSCVRRTRSNTPLQALTTLNEPTFNQAARWLGWRALQEGGNTDRERLIYAFRLCVSRVPLDGERDRLMRLLTEAREEFVRSPGDAAPAAFTDPKAPGVLPRGATIPDLAAWTAVSRVLLNLDETITKE